MNRSTDYEIAGRAKQSGSIMIVAIVSILGVGAVAAGTNALLTQNAITVNEKTRALHGNSVGDSVRLLNDGGVNIDANANNTRPNDIERVMYPGANFNTHAQSNAATPGFDYDGYIEINNAQYGYSIGESGLDPIRTEKQLRDRMKSSPDNSCSIDEFDNDEGDIEIDILCDDDAKELSFTKALIFGDEGADGAGEVDFAIDNSENLDSIVIKDGLFFNGEDFDIELDDFKGDLSISGPINIKKTDGDAEWPFDMEGIGDITVGGGVLLEGDGADIIDNEIKSSISMNGPLIITATDGDAVVEFDIKEGGSISGLKGVLIDGETALFKFKGINDLLEIDGPVILDASNGEAKAEFEFDGSGSLKIPEKTDVYSQNVVFIRSTDDKAELQFKHTADSDISDSVVMGAPVLLEGNNGDAKIQIQGEDKENSVSVKFLEKVFLKGNKAKFEVNELEKGQTIFSNGAYFDSISHDEDVKFEFEELNEYDLVFDGGIFSDDYIRFELSDIRKSYYNIGGGGSKPLHRNYRATEKDVNPSSSLDNPPEISDETLESLEKEIKEEIPDRPNGSVSIGRIAIPELE
ncbi:hypothetical protein [Spiribacter vilamensis]|uniref:Uncharacterized protein n=1 Tax=Spiribacter vilamensis TaxID=531306 RepID=A0A4Q8CZY6_9GAMM|nr:hypothetical protein [Spiribacter vilamensis]RZU98611.1 hypothetical protein EV698_0865 [Spiribacter vilamensis]TVO60131.1 hypothetical protein FPL09_09870 [Spiribacter vilamensis]